MQHNKTKARLKAGETVFGCFVRYPNATLVEVLGYYGWDFIVFDAEHGTIEPRDCEEMVRAAELRDITPIIRVTTNLPATILRFMDTGAQGLHIPMINSASDARKAVSSVKYQPLGIRGLAGIRAADFGQACSLKDYVAQANEETLISAHIETTEGVRQLPEILDVPDLDIVFVGPNDLSHSLGYPGETQHPKVQETITHIAETVTASKKVLGLMVSTAEAASEWRRRGARYITIGLESLLGPACRNYLEGSITD